ncbi:hypothetical protein HELRODRAFT_162298 [Helobdella robusta]|uniref:Uncharacterized protein n=1 Tax=Helobdella robusta TaxID=6412 RepID=T1ESG9_HELRO|nr:hypothetical protein HELRODRAFT_162298 [Helobdella robusta]ESN98838.1 hypothetical protein HELRODRAFT_162298 [Helobdella robusta]
MAGFKLSCSSTKTCNLNGIIKYHKHEENHSDDNDDDADHNFINNSSCGNSESLKKIVSPSTTANSNSIFNNNNTTPNNNNIYGLSSSNLYPTNWNSLSWQMFNQYHQQSYQHSQLQKFYNFSNSCKNVGKDSESCTINNLLSYQNYNKSCDLEYKTTPSFVSGCNYPNSDMTSFNNDTNTLQDHIKSLSDTFSNKLSSSNNDYVIHNNNNSNNNNNPYSPLAISNKLMSSGHSFISTNVSDADDNDVDGYDDGKDDSDNNTSNNCQDSEQQQQHSSETTYSHHKLTTNLPTKSLNSTPDKGSI